LETLNLILTSQGKEETGNCFIWGNGGVGYMLKGIFNAVRQFFSCQGLEARDLTIQVRQELEYTVRLGSFSNTR
jgi:hypothetical protein